MRLIDDVEKIIANYELKPIEIPTGFKNLYEYEEQNPQDVTYYYAIEKNDNYFIEKYVDYVPNGWYGFSIGVPIIPVWMDIIDEVLELCVKNDPEFQIHQIKLKFGGIRFYTHSNIIEDITDIGLLIEYKLHDNALIY